MMMENGDPASHSAQDRNRESGPILQDECTHHELNNKGKVQTKSELVLLLTDPPLKVKLQSLVVNFSTKKSETQSPKIFSQNKTEKVSKTLQELRMLSSVNQRLSRVQVLNCQNCNQCLKGHKSLRLSRLSEIVKVVRNCQCCQKLS